MLRRGLMASLFLLTVTWAVEPVHAALEVPEDLAPLAGTSLFSSLPRFELELSSEGDSQLVIGINAFTPQQLLQFVNALPDFLEGAAKLAEGQTLVLRQNGIQGYVALAAVFEPERGSIRYTLTFQAEAPSSVAGVSAVQSLGFEIANMLLTQE